MLALPTLLQIFLGGPQLSKEFETYDEDGTRLLLVFLKNRPVKRPLGRFALVKRDTVQSLTATFQIVEAQSKSIIVPIHQARISSDADPPDTERYRVTLPPTFSVGASITVAIWNAANGRAEIPPTRRKASVPLDVGTYEARLIVHVDGTRNNEAKGFTVGRTPEDLLWL